MKRNITNNYISLKNLPSSIGLSIELKYPTSCQQERLRLPEHPPTINVFVDSVLKTVYDHASSSRPIIFSSFNPAVCTALTWKQPNYGVFFKTWGGLAENGTDSSGQLVALRDTDRRCNSIKEALRFARRMKFLGVICEATPLVRIQRIYS